MNKQILIASVVGLLILIPAAFWIDSYNHAPVKNNIKEQIPVANNIENTVEAPTPPVENSEASVQIILSTDDDFPSDTNESPQDHEIEEPPEDPIIGNFQCKGDYNFEFNIRLRSDIPVWSQGAWTYTTDYNNKGDRVTLTGASCALTIFE